MKASYLGAMGYALRRDFPATWPTPPAYNDPELSVQSYQDGIEECEFAEEMGFEWISFSEHHYSGRIATGTPSVMAAAVAERCKKARMAMLGHLLPLNNPVRIAEELALLDNLTNGRLVMGFLRGTPNEDQVYNVNPAEGRGRMLESMDLILRALTEPQPFAWEGRYYQYRTVSVWPRPVQQPMPPAIVATRSDDAVHFAATHQSGPGRIVPASGGRGDHHRQVLRLVPRRPGGEPEPDEVVFRGSIYLAETDEKAWEWFHRQEDQGRARGMAMRSSVAQVIQAQRTGQDIDYSHVFAGSASGDIVGGAPGLTFVGRAGPGHGTDKGLPRPLRRRGHRPLLSATQPDSPRHHERNRAVRAGGPAQNQGILSDDYGQGQSPLHSFGPW